MMRVIRNKVILSLFLIFAVLFSLSFVSSADVITVIAPTTGSTLSGTVFVNVTNSTDFNTMTNCSFYFKSTLTANSSWTLVGTFLNHSLIDVNGTFDASILEDANNYILNASCRNYSNGNISALVTGLILDSTTPTDPTSLLPTSDTDGTVNFSGSVTDRETTSCTLIFKGINPGKSSYTMAYSGTSCSYQLTNVPEQSYQWVVRASDESDTTDSAVQTTNVDVKTSAGKSALLIAEGKAKSEGGALLSIIPVGGIFSGSTPWIILGIILFVVVVIILVVRKK